MEFGAQRICFIAEDCGAQVEKMKEIARIKAKEERKRLETEVKCLGVVYLFNYILLLSDVFYVFWIYVIVLHLDFNPNDWT